MSLNIQGIGEVIMAMVVVILFIPEASSKPDSYFISSNFLMDFHLIFTFTPYKYGHYRCITYEIKIKCINFNPDIALYFFNY